MTCWQALANAIVEQAAKDYLAVLRLLKKYPDSVACQERARYFERFFHSGWYEILTEVNPDYLIQRLRKVAMQ